MHMPRSQSPVVSHSGGVARVCHSTRETHAFQHIQTVGFSRLRRRVIYAIPIDHNYTIFGDQSRGLRTHYTWLYTHSYDYAYRFTSREVAMLSGWDLCNVTTLTHWVT